MKLENIIKKLEKENVQVVTGKFFDKEVYFAEGTALVDIVDGIVKDTNAKLSEVVEQITNNSSHIQDVVGKKKTLTTNKKMGY